MSRVLAHRGPDDEGYVLIDGPDVTPFCGADSPPEIQARLPRLDTGGAVPKASIGLAHRRFSIVDLSSAGHQPFEDADGACVVVFNGEIYNYVELRAELEHLGVRFRTHSDTEVLVEAYKAWGTECFSRFNGFWAVAIYDRRRRALLLSRDRMGKKPLFWTRVGDTVHFASEIKALLRVPAVHAARRVNDAAAVHWLVFGQKDIDDDTMFAGIHSLPAASWTWVDREFPHRVQRYWSLPDQRSSERDISPEEAAKEVRRLLEDSVQLRLRADVPVCVELSGGMDSSVVVALASMATSKPVTTYTVRFDEPEWNEEPFARSVAQRFGVDYRVLDPPPFHFWQQIRAFTYLEEEPYHAPNLQTNQEIWSSMRDEGMRVSLNGAAGDELFAGYRHYHSLAQTEALLRGRFGRYAREASSHSEAESPLGSFVEQAVGMGKGIGRALLPPALTSAAWRAGVVNPTYRSVLRRSRSYLTLSAALHGDMTSSLMPYWLRSGDRGFMGVPLEVRAPFLDYKVVEYAFGLPVTYLLRDGWHKWILRKAMEDVLPDDVLWRRQKLGFPFPFERFFAESRPVLDEVLSNGHNPYLDLGRRARFEQNWKVWSFVLWYEMFFNDNLALFDRIEEMAAVRAAGNGRFRPEYLRTGTTLSV
jgi:asparagine synthase (glutamine-hydrolysing)